MKVFALTLKRTPERWEYIESHLKELKMDYEIVDGVDYKNYTEEEYRAFYDEETVRNNPLLTKGLIGCSQSHVKIFRKMLGENLPYAFIIEDDAILPRNIKEILALLEKEIGKNEVIILSYYNHFSNETTLSNYGRKTIENGMELVYPMVLPEIASTMAYVITREVAEKLVNIMAPTYAPPDYWGHHYSKGGFTSMRCLYPVVAKPAPFRTTIDYAGSQSLKSKLAALVRRYKVPGLYQFLENRTNKLLADKYTFHFTDEKPKWLDSKQEK